MLTQAHDYDFLLTSPAGAYIARVYGRPEEDGTWGGWLVFFPAGGGRVIATDRETTQPSLADLSYWAAGLSEVYLQGALERALDLQPEAQLARELERLEQIELTAASRADTLEAAASRARVTSRRAEAAREDTEDRLLESVADAAEADAEAHEEAAAESRARAQAADRLARGRRRRKRSKH